MRSRSVMGAVVDSLGLRLLSATPDYGTGAGGLSSTPAAPGDSIVVTFYQNGVKARLANREARARYGQILDLGTVRFSVASVPDVPSANLYVIPREMAIDNLLAGLQVLHRADTDIMDVVYLSRTRKWPSGW